VVVVALSRQAGPARTTIATADNATRVAIEIPVAESRAPTPDPRVPGTDPRLTATDTSRLPGLEPRQALQTLAIDPGHGGDEIGVRGGNGLEEKQLTLDIARRLRGLVERGLGVRVILTRDEDRTVGIDERAAAANNGKADLLLSIHANGALSGSPSGAEVFFERLDREGEAVRRSAAAGAISLPVVGGGTRSIEVVPWDLAQARHIDASAMLASVLEQELRQRVPMGQRPIQQGPIRLLSAANMPAALVEMAYLTNSAQEKAAAGEEFKNAVAQALYNAIVRFRGYLEETSAP
jgi:N-acetylmuramoyl-L-alanine amidase